MEGYETYFNIREMESVPMPMTPREMVKLLKENGFVEQSQNGSHKKMVKPGANMHPIIVPMHSKDLKKGIEKAILKQAGLMK